MRQLSEADKIELAREWELLQDPCGAPECVTEREESGHGCDCNHSAIVVTDIGYVELFQDGEVYAHGRMIFNASEGVY